MVVKPAPTRNPDIRMRPTTRRDWVKAIKGVNDS